MVNLEGKIYSCKHCKTHLALCEDIVSKVGDRLMISDSYVLRLFIYESVDELLSGFFCQLSISLPYVGSCRNKKASFC